MGVDKNSTSIQEKLTSFSCKQESSCCHPAKKVNNIYIKLTAINVEYISDIIVRLSREIKNRPDILAMAIFPSREKLKYKPTTPDHLSYFQFDLDAHEHLHTLSFPCI